MSAIGGPNIVDDNLILSYDVANIKSFRGEPTTNLKLSAQDARFDYSTGEYVFHGLETTGEFAGWYKITATSTSVNRLIMGLNGINALANIQYTASIEWVSPNNSLSFEVNGNQGFGVPTLIPGQPNRYARTFTKNATTSGQHFYLRSANGSIGPITNGIIYYRNIQWEQKPYATAFTLTSRGSTVETGGGLIDQSGNNNSGELINNPIYTSDNLGGLVFDGVDDLIQTNFGNGYNVFTNNLTVSAWVKSDTTSGQRMWLDVGGNGTDQRFYLSIVTAGRSDFGIQSSGWVSGIPVDTDWHHQTLVMNNGTALYYDNGVQVQSKNYTPYTLPGDIRLGGRGSSFQWEGKINNFKVYDRALTADEVFQNYNATKNRFL